MYMKEQKEAIIAYTEACQKHEVDYQKYSLYVHGFLLPEL